MCPIASWHAGDAGVELEVLAGGESAVGGERLRHISDRSSHLKRFPLDIVAGDQGAAAARRQQRRDHP